MTVCRLYVFVNVEGSYLHPGGKLLTSLRKVGFFLCISKLNRTFAGINLNKQTEAMGTY